MLSHYRRFFFLVAGLLTLTLIVNSVQNAKWRSFSRPPPSFVSIDQSSSTDEKKITRTPLKSAEKPISQAAFQPTKTFTPTPVPSILGPDYDPNLDLMAGPVSLPLTLLIPILEVDAPILGVGLTENNDMDAPKGPYGDPNWSSAFWYRGSDVPGEPGTATIAGHVNGLLGQPETFARIRKLKPGDEIIILVNETDQYIYFVVDEVKRYSVVETEEPDIHARIFGGNVLSEEGQSLSDGISHLTLITCTGSYIDGEFDHRTIVFATLRK